MVQAKDSELYKPVLMESYTSPDSIVHVSGASYPALVFWFELPVVELRFHCPCIRYIFSVLRLQY
ncbi:hypothetical protein NC653_041376 [Populus alba x Populus x berolinensis]|uniref:Uncharacterized protein n=1 Tax=Populus alba x Populus x berolinensis TaxID=444605 RepID=A0AAD6L8A1_9ROSI|nr:hypothetical protein NC653_041376 [Populus alba x Populus x berolinensis]